MDEVIAILSQVAKHGPLERVDGSADLPAEAAAELIETGYLRGTKVGTLEQPHAFLNVRITTPGRECLKVLLLEHSLWRRAVRSFGTAAGQIAVGVAVGLMLLLVTVVANAQTITGRVVGISDGDTFTVLTDELQQVKVRLAEIDAPERGQPFGRRSHEALSKMIFHQEVRIEIQTTDRYGRLVGRPFVGKSDVCAEMVGIGAAWVYRKYLLDQNLLEIEDDARSAKRGLWGLPESDAVPPWEWRRIGDQAAGPNGCEIKGNIGNRGVKIYHMPGSRAYGGTKIDQERGERWFCSEQEAQAAGWRVIRR